MRQNHQKKAYRIRNPKAFYTMMDTPGVATHFALLAEFPLDTDMTIILLAEATLSNIFGSWQDALYKKICVDGLPDVPVRVALNRMSPLVWSDGESNYETRRKNRKALLLKAGQSASWNVFSKADKVGNISNYTFKVGQYNIGIPVKIAKQLNLLSDSSIIVDFEVTPAKRHPDVWATDA